MNIKKTALYLDPDITKGDTPDSLKQQLSEIDARLRNSSRFRLTHVYCDVITDENYERFGEWATDCAEIVMKWAQRHGITAKPAIVIQQYHDNDELRGAP